MIQEPPEPVDQQALERLGRVVRSLRRESALSQADLAGRAGLSPRFLAQLEAGTGNISFLRLHRLARALELPVSTLVERAEAEAPRHIALLGMRGAGKSSVGSALAHVLHRPFVEVDQLVEEEAGLPLAQIFELQGDAYYRRLEARVIRRRLQDPEPAVLAVGGGIVTSPEIYAHLLDRAVTVWLRARPGDHWERVLHQGDRRPLVGHPHAMTELERLWGERAPLYARARHTVATTDRDIPAVVEEIHDRLTRDDVPRAAG
jgi:XRE family aerobic/anaerobic benzoate catabolism transcriptional regulator